MTESVYPPTHPYTTYDPTRGPGGRGGGRGGALPALGTRPSKEGLYIDIRRKAVELLEAREETVQALVKRL
jgi:hypothetical protein